MNAGPAKPAEEKLDFQKEADQKQSHIFSIILTIQQRMKNLMQGKRQKRKINGSVLQIMKEA